jgi:hypothetical protein
MTEGGSFDHHNDDDLMRALAQAVQASEPVPAEVVAAAKASFTWRTLEAELAELAELTFDSLADALVGVRGPGGPRALTFEHEDVVVELEITEDGPRRTLVGHITPSTVDGVELHQASGTEPVRFEADSFGRFRVPGIAAGPFRLLCRFRQGEPRPVMLTQWVTI